MLNKFEFILEQEGLKSSFLRSLLTAVNVSDEFSYYQHSISLTYEESNLNVKA